MNVRERMQRKAEDVAREVSFSHSPPRDIAYALEYDPVTRAHYEVGVFDWARGRVRVDSRTLDVQIERKP